jgi:hypothetical protein
VKDFWDTFFKYGKEALKPRHFLLIALAALGYFAMIRGGVHPAWVILATVVFYSIDQFWKYVFSHREGRNLSNLRDIIQTEFQEDLKVKRAELPPPSDLEPPPAPRPRTRARTQ